MPEAILDWGVEFVIMLQAMGDWLVAPMNFFTFLGMEEFFLLLLPFLYLSIEFRLGVRVAVYLFISIWTNWVFKVLFHEPRPYWVSQAVPLLAPWENNFGIPSGHAQNAVVMWGTIAMYIRRPWAWITAIFLMFFIAISRLFLGAHYPTDILLGWILGIILLWLLARLEPRVLAWFRPFSTSAKTAILFAISLGGILISVLITTWLDASWEIPAAWIELAAIYAPDEHFYPQSFTGMITTMATLFGLTAGAVWIDVRGGFDAGGPLLKRAARYLLGLAGAVVLWAGLDIVFSSLAADESLFGYLLRFLRYSVVGIWISYITPLICLRLKLTEKRQEE